MDEEDSSIDFQEHRSFTKEIGKFSKKYNDNNCFKHLKTLLEKHFNPTKPEICLSPKVLRKVSNIGPNITVYKVNMAVKGLKSGQFPRVCFWKVGNIIYFLSFGTHLENYKESELKKDVINRIAEIDPSLTLN